jgi:hypothetical protein
MMKTIIQLALEVEHDDTSDPNDVAKRVVRVASSVVNGLAFEDELLADIRMYGTKVLASSHAVVARGMPVTQIAALTDNEKHRAWCHPDWEYAQTETQRKIGTTLEPEGEGWIKNDRVPCHLYEAGVLVEERWRNWERFEFHEVEYWRRPRT